jgi:hypothetical protein
MRVLKGMEVQVILNDVAGIMDLPFPDNEPLETSAQLTASNKEQAANKDRTWPDPISPASSSNEMVSDDNGSDDLFSWPSELKLALNNVKNNLALAVTNASATVSGGITVPGGRKRKMWDNTDSPVAKVATSPQNRQQISLAEDQQMVVTEPLMVGDCSSGSSAKLMTTLTHFKDNKEPLPEVSAPVVRGTEHRRDKVRKGDSGKGRTLVRTMRQYFWLWDSGKGTTLILIMRQ